MKTFENIQKSLKANDNQMALKMGLPGGTAWKKFRDSKGIALRNLVKLWRLSGESGDAFMATIESELYPPASKRKKAKS